MPDLLRRVAVLTVLSAVGLALIAPLTVRSALPDAPTADERLLDRAPFTYTSLDRGALPGRDAPNRLVAAAGASGVERPFTLELPTPVSAPMEATLHPVATPKPARPVVPPPSPDAGTVSGTASWYCHKVGTCPAGFTPADAFVALPGALGGAGGSGVVGHVTVCADRCVELPVVDYCGCYWGMVNQRVADLSAAAWALVTDTPRTAGVLQVTLHLGG